MNKLQNHWVLPSERGWVNGSLMFAAYIGLVVGMPLVAWLIDQYGWRTMFFISGAVSVLGVAVFWLVVYDYPKDHPAFKQFFMPRGVLECKASDVDDPTEDPRFGRVGATRDAKWLRDWISSPETVDPFASMPPFGELLNEEQMEALVQYLAARK